MSDDEDEPGDRVKKIMKDDKQRVDQFVDLLFQCAGFQEAKNAIPYFLGVSEKLRDTELKLHLADLKQGITESSLETARETIQALYEIATEAPQSRLRDDLTRFIDEAKRRFATQGLQL
jgi:hypothetical protein